MDIFTQTDLIDLLASLPARTSNRQLALWRLQKEQKRRTTALLQSLGKSVTAAQVKRLDSLNLDHSTLRALRSSPSDNDEFQAVLKKRGVRSKPLREKLAAIVRQ